MTVETDVAKILDSVLSLQGRSASWQRHTPLLGAVPELDSMAVVGIIAALEDRFAIILHDEDINSASFATLGSLCDLVAAKLAE